MLGGENLGGRHDGALHAGARRRQQRQKRHRRLPAAHVALWTGHNHNAVGYKSPVPVSHLKVFLGTPMYSRSHGCRGELASAPAAGGS